MKDYKEYFELDPFAASDACREHPWDQYIPPFEIVTGVYYVSGIAWVGCYLIDTGAGLVLIDTAFHESVYLLIDAIWRLGYDPKDIKAIFLSHIHFDHINGAKALKELTNADIYMSKHDLRHLQDKKLSFQNEAFVSGSITPDHFYEDFDSITIGNVTFKTILCPGHTPGTTSFVFDIVDKNAGKLTVAMHGGLGLNTMRKDYLKENDLPLDLQEKYLDSMHRMKNIDVDVCIPSHPGHYDILALLPLKTPEFNPYINKEAWIKLLTGFENGMKQILLEEAQSEGK